MKRKSKSAHLAAGKKESFLGPDGRVLYFSIDQFVTTIGRGNCCFLCGVSPSDAIFNEEHVLPEWLLREYGLFDERITLPNGHSIKYARYTVPCCTHCNAFLGKHIESPISALLKSGFTSVKNAAGSGELGMLFVWLALIFLKTHLKDRHLNFHLDKRQGVGKIADSYDWASLHHIHCLVRTIYTGCGINENAFGSMLIVPTTSLSEQDRFYYGDTYLPKTVVLRLRDFAIIAVLNDCGAALSYHYGGLLRRLKGPLSPLQLMEVFAHMAYVNFALKPRPRFFTKVTNGRAEITARRPKQIKLAKLPPKAWSSLFLHCIDRILLDLKVRNADEIRANIRTGRWTFLTDMNGEFIKNSIVPVDSR